MSLFGVMTVLVVTIACTQPKADPASVSRGGTVYDKWWKVAEEAIEPTENQLLYINYDSKKVIRTNVEYGWVLYTSTCVACYGTNSKQILFNR